MIIYETSQVTFILTQSRFYLHLEGEKIKFEMQKNLKTRVNIPRVEI